ncbi:MAG: hypothetical protein ACP5IL_06820 [Syntrophobacteraceae bacterium]
MMLSGKNISSCFPGTSENDLLPWCRAGRLRAFQKSVAPLGLDPKSPKGWRRVYPTSEAGEKYNLLCLGYASLMKWLKSRRVSDEEVMEAERDRIAQGFQKVGKPVEFPEIEQFQYNLFRRRQHETAQISRLLSEIAELENELRSPALWNDPQLIVSDLSAFLQQSFFRIKDLEKILKAPC